MSTELEAPDWLLKFSAHILYFKEKYHDQGIPISGTTEYFYSLNKIVWQRKMNWLSLMKL